MLLFNVVAAVACQLRSRKKDNRYLGIFLAKHHAEPTDLFQFLTPAIVNLRRLVVLIPAYGRCNK